MKKGRLLSGKLISEDRLRTSAYVVCYVLVLAVIAHVMFELWYVTLFAAVVFLPFSVKKASKQVCSRRIRRQEAEFSLFLRKLSASLSAGMTIRNAVGEIVMHDKSEYKYLHAELERVHKLLEYNHCVQDAFDSLARRCPCDDIRMFADCLSYGIPSGVDMVNLIRYVSSAFEVKNDTRREIEQTLNLPKYNNRIMLCAPVGCLILIKSIASEYIAPLYTGVGRIVMVVVALLLVFAAVMGSLIADVKY